MSPLRSCTLLAALLGSTPGWADTYSLTIDTLGVNYTGTETNALAINGQIPAPLLRFRDGEQVVIHVTNKLDVPSSIHWHGLLVPPEMDGVPGISFDGIPPGETFTYRFPIRQTGTYWYHSHSGYQEAQGLYGPMIIDPADGPTVAYDREYTVLLSDWLDETPAETHANLKSMSDYYNYAQRTLVGFWRDARETGFESALDDRLSWGEMRMMPSDISDVSGYTFLLNGQTTDAPWSEPFSPGERIRLRFINGSAMSYFDVRIPGLPMTIIQTDGQDVQPVEMDEFRIAVAETYDVIVTAGEAENYTILAEAMDRTGFAAGRISQRDATGPIDLPASRPRGQLTHADMPSTHTGGHGQQDDPGEEQMAGHSMEGHSMPGHDMPDHNMPDHNMPDHNMPDHNMEGHSMPGHDMPDHNMTGHAGHTAHQMHMNHGSMDAMPTPPPAIRNHEHVPPVGAPDGARVLNYGDLAARHPNPQAREPEREIVVRLGGNMERYVWTLNDQKYEDAEPIELVYGERVRLTFVNETMMNHPMHLHGMFVELENGQPVEDQPRKHVVNVGPGRTYSVDLDVTEPGEWAFHCHLMFHMASGMMRKVVVARLPQEAAL
jgi:CopA family copper-resistance protein